MVSFGLHRFFYTTSRYSTRSLFTFVAEPRAKADNNAAERSLRPTVVSRKISVGTRLPEGSNTKSVLASLFGTWRLRGRNPYQALNSIRSQPLLAPV